MATVVENGDTDPLSTRRAVIILDEIADLGDGRGPHAVLDDVNQVVIRNIPDRHINDPAGTVFTYRTSNMWNSGFDQITVKLADDPRGGGGGTTGVRCGTGIVTRKAGPTFLVPGGAGEES